MLMADPPVLTAPTYQQPESEVTQQPRPIQSEASGADRIFRSIIVLAGVTVLVIMSAIGLFLTLRAVSALRVAGWSFVTTADWNPEAGTFGVAAVLLGTVLIGLVAIVVAVPLALGTALFISEYAPSGLQRTLVNLVDFMAAIPSVVYGLWGFFLLQPVLLVNGPQGDGLPRWLATYFGWLPVFEVRVNNEPVDPLDPSSSGTVYTASAFIAGLVVALMVMPIACSIMRESFSQAPIGEREGALALGSTRWGMIRAVVLPFGTGGIIGGTMLALGRALGETIAVFMIISVVFDIKIRILETGTSSVSSLIALRFAEASPFGLSALMAAGLTLFIMTLIVNFVASAVIARSRSGAVSDA